MWSKIDGTIAHHPKLTAAGPVAAWYYVCGLTFASTYGTDGLIPDGDALHLTPLDDPKDAIRRLVAVGLWHRCKGGYQIHDFLDYQPSAARMKAGRAASRKRQADYRRRNAVTNAERNDSSNGVTNASNTRTDKEVEVELRVNPAPLPPTPPAADPEARADSPRALRAVPKPHELERAAIESHPLTAALVERFGPVTARDLDAWRDDLATLDELGATPEQVPIAAEAYAAIMGDDNGRPILLTRPALIRHWHRCIQAANYPPARVTVDGRMPIHGELDDGKYTGNGKYARFFNRPYDDDEPYDDVNEASP